MLYTVCTGKKICYVQENDEGDNAKILYKDAAYYGAFVRSEQSCAARYINMHNLTLSSKSFKIAFNHCILSFFQKVFLIAISLRPDVVDLLYFKQFCYIK